MHKKWTDRVELTKKTVTPTKNRFSPTGKFFFPEKSHSAEKGTLGSQNAVLGRNIRFLLSKRNLLRI